MVKIKKLSTEEYSIDRQRSVIEIKSKIMSEYKMADKETKIDLAPIVNEVTSLIESKKLDNKTNRKICSRAYQTFKRSDKNASDGKGQKEGRGNKESKRKEGTGKTE
jgi:hypothetical protein